MKSIKWDEKIDQTNAVLSWISVTDISDGDWSTWINKTGQSAEYVDGITATLLGRLSGDWQTEWQCHPSANSSINTIQSHLIISLLYLSKQHNSSGFNTQQITATGQSTVTCCEVLSSYTLANYLKLVHSVHVLSKIHFTHLQKLYTIRSVK